MKQNDLTNIPAAACQQCGGWTSQGGMSQHSKAVEPVDGRTGCTGPHCGVEHHYFASFGMGWKTADTRSEAVKGLVAGFRPEFKSMTAASHKKGGRGAYIWSCRVEVPSDVNYDIEWFAPKGVTKTDAKEHYVTYVTNKEIAYYTEGGDK